MSEFTDTTYIINKMIEFEKLKHLLLNEEQKILKLKNRILQLRMKILNKKNKNKFKNSYQNKSQLRDSLCSLPGIISNNNKNKNILSQSISPKLQAEAEALIIQTQEQYSNTQRTEEQTKRENYLKQEENFLKFKLDENPNLHYKKYMLQKYQLQKGVRSQEDCDQQLKSK
ncbi:hypothetical protein ABPG72_021818 [Tetrahymena utriculariae]